MDQNFYRTGAAAKTLGISPYRIRALCQAGLIANAEYTEGGQWLVPASEVARMSKDGVPPTPKTMAPPASGSGRLQAKRNPNPLIAAPSEDAINAAENSFIAERQFAADTHKLSRLRVRKEGLELQDWFDERNEARLQKELEADRRQAEAEQKRIQQRQAAEAAQEQRRFCAKWLAYAIDQKPRNSPEDFALMIQQQVLSALAEIPSDQDDWTIRSVVDAAIARSLRPWRDDQASRQAKRNALDSALSRMPIQMRWDETWRARAEQSIREAVDNACDGTAAAAAKLAVEPLIAKYQHQQKVDEAVRWVITPGTSDEDDEARESVRAALNTLPVGCSDREFQRTKESALEPIRDRIATRVQREQEAREREASKRRLIEIGLREVWEYAKALKAEYDYAPAESALTIELRCRAAVEKALRSEVTGNETEDDIVELVHEAMEEEEGIEE